MTSHLPHTELTPEAMLFWTLAVVMLILGLAVIWIAFQGYRRNDSRPMLFIAIGFAFLLFPDIFVMIAGFLVEFTEFQLQTMYQLTSIAGVSCILYAIVMEP